MKDIMEIFHREFGVKSADSESVTLFINKINNRIVDAFTMNALLHEEIGDCFIWKVNSTYDPLYWHTFKFFDTKIDLFVLFDENNYNRATIGFIVRVNKKVRCVNTYRYIVDTHSDCLFIWQNIDMILDDMIDKTIDRHWNALSLEASTIEWVVNLGDGTMGSVAHKKERFQTMYKRLRYELDTWK